MLLARISVSHLPQHTYPAQPVDLYSVKVLTLGRRATSKRHASAAVPAGRANAAAAEKDVGKAKTWGIEEFGSLQKNASTRLHRFYVPQPLGPTTKPPSLESLLSPTSPETPAAVKPPLPLRAPASVSATASPPPTASAPGITTASVPGGHVSPASVVLEGEEARHAARALRLQLGDCVELCDGRGNLLRGVVSGSDKQRMWVAPDGPVVHVPWRGSRWVVAVACTTLKGGRAEWLVEKLTELGAFMMIPLVTERSQASGKAKFRTRGSSNARNSDGGGSAAAAVDGGADTADGDYQPGRLERVAIAATKQSLRPHVLHLAPPTALADVLPLVQRCTGRSSSSSSSSGNSSTGSYCGGSDGDDDGPGRAAPRTATHIASRSSKPHFPAAAGGVGGVGGGVGGVGGGVGGVGGGQPEAGEKPASVGPSPGRGGECRERLGDGTLMATAAEATASGSGSDDGGGESFCLIAVAGAPPLATVLGSLLRRATPAAGSLSVLGDNTLTGGGPQGPVRKRGCDAAGESEGPLRVLFIGPEGDFTPAELAALVQAGARPVGLGTNRLRTETAAIGLLAACLLTEDEGAEDELRWA